MEPSSDPDDASAPSEMGEPGVPGGPTGGGRTPWLIGGAIALALIALGAFLLLRDDGDDDVDTADTTTTSTTSGESTTTTAPDSTTSTTFAPTVDPSVPIFPDPSTSARYDDPVAVATAFAKEMVGYTNPVAGTFQAGDSRSGEVEIRGNAAAAPSVVAVRQLEDDTWYVVAANVDSIRLSSPTAGATVSSPLDLTGQAYAFEGVVNVRLFADGTQAPIGETTVMGRGDGVLGDFSGSLTFPAPSTDYGVLILSEASAEDGGAVAVTAIRVAF